MEKTLHALVLPAGSLTLYKSWGRSQLLMIAEETINFVNRILKSVEWQTPVKERIIEQRFEFSSFYMKKYNEECGTEYLLMANGIDWSAFKTFVEEDDPFHNHLKKLTFHFGSVQESISSNEDHFEIFVPKEKIESVKQAVLRLARIAREEKYGTAMA